MTPAALNVEGRTAMAKVTTGSGDTGYTSLLGDQRVPKYDPRPDTYGTTIRAQTPTERWTKLLPRSGWPGP